MTYQRDKSKVKEYNKMRYETNKESILARQKQYRENNPDKIKERRKAYLEANKEQIKDKKGAKMVCECGEIITYGCHSRHTKTQKHLRILEAKYTKI